MSDALVLLVGALGAGIGAATTAIMGYLKDRNNRGIRQAETRQMELSNESSLRQEISNLHRDYGVLWKHLYLAQQRIFHLEQFLREQGYDPAEIPGMPPLMPPLSD